MNRFLMVCLVTAFMAGCASTSSDIEWLKQSSVDVRFMNSLPDGPYLFTSAGGARQVEGAFDHGARVGIWRWFDSTGVKTVELNYKADRKQGPFGMWYSGVSRSHRPGALKLKGEFSDDSFNGKILSHWDTGGKRSERAYDHGVLQTARLWDPDGKELPPEDAMAQARRDLDSDRRYLTTLESTVRQSLQFSRRADAP